MNTVTTYEIVIVSNATTRAYSVSNPYTDLLSAQNDLNSRNELIAGSEYRIRKVETSYITSLPKSENERIKELADQALKECDAAKERGIDQYSKRFAELIVRECAAYIDDNIGYDDCNNTYPVTGDVLKDHFGVKE